MKQLAKKTNLKSNYTFFVFIYKIILDSSSINFSEEKEEDGPKNCTPEIDDEGYRIQPTGPWNVDKGNFDSSSDSGC